ncbi:glycosyltransferase family 61 protein [Halioglobus maricola]|uniref:Glycosyltransferase family 61 protein n=1 Tax=Halioglobus maricola TaxID=2601894 RepID=A0A5P9NF94_9GAMM|nr:glycosyltransferase family 61 protein [Halioglobus maricola]QFU74453.1 glycosyltransferase family 61 protein [Halioglobus maricola]
MRASSAKTARYDHDICVTFQISPNGSVQHYYHYLFGYLIPLVIAYQRVHKRRGLGSIYVRSCAILDAHTEALALEKLTILPREEHASLEQSSISPNNRTLLHLSVRGMDKPWLYRAEAILLARSFILKRLSAQIESFRQSTAMKFAGSSKKVLLINRDKPPKFYLTAESETKSAGAARRSLPNFDAIISKLNKQYGQVAGVHLEDMTLAEQISLFQMADIVIGQHGAALGNIIWCRSDASAVEIYPRMEEPRKRLHFERLAESLGLAYFEVQQNDIHAALDAEQLLATTAAIPKPPSREWTWKLILARKKIMMRLRSLVGRGPPPPT